MEKPDQKRHLILLYQIVLGELYDILNNKSSLFPRKPNGLCWMIFILRLKNKFSYSEYKRLNENMESYLNLLPNINGYCNYKWIPMKKSQEGIQPRIDFIESIIDKLKLQENGN